MDQSALCSDQVQTPQLPPSCLKSALRHFSATAPSLPTEESAANPALSDLRSLLIRDLPTSLTVGESAKYISKRRQIFQCVPRQYEHDIDGSS